MNPIPMFMTSNAVAPIPAGAAGSGTTALLPEVILGSDGSDISAGSRSCCPDKDKAYRFWERIDLSEERGSGVVEWLGIAALSIAMLVGIFAGMEQVANGVIDMIRASLGVG